MPDQSFSSFMQERQAAPPAAAPDTSLSFGDFMQERQPASAVAAPDWFNRAEPGALTAQPVAPALPQATKPSPFAAPPAPAVPIHPADADALATDTARKGAALIFQHALAEANTPRAATPIPRGLMTPEQEQAQRAQRMSAFEAGAPLSVLPLTAGQGFEAALNLDPSGILPGLAETGQGLATVATGPTLRQRAGGLHRALGGAFEAGTPFMGGAALKAPLMTAGTLAAGMVSQEAVARGLKKLGMPEEYADLAGDLAGIIAGAGAHELTPKAVAAIKAKYGPILKARAEKAAAPPPEEFTTTGQPVRAPAPEPAQPPAGPTEEAVRATLARKRQRGEKYSAWQARLAELDKRAEPAQAVQPPKAAEAPTPAKPAPEAVQSHAEPVQRGSARVEKTTPVVKQGEAPESVGTAMSALYGETETPTTKLTRREEAPETPTRKLTRAPETPERESVQTRAEPSHGVSAEIGPHGPVFRDFRHDATAAISELSRLRDGEAIAALHHPQVGDIDLIWGKPGEKGYGLAKISERHPEVLPDLQGVLDRLQETSRNENTIQLGGDGYSAIVRRNWKGDPKTWLLTAFGKTAEPIEEEPSAGRTIDVPGTHATERQAPPPGGSGSSVTEPPPPTKAARAKRIRDARKAGATFEEAKAQADAEAPAPAPAAEAEDATARNFRRALRTRELREEGWSFSDAARQARAEIPEPPAEARQGAESKSGATEGTHAVAGEDTQPLERGAAGSGEAAGERGETPPGAEVSGRPVEPGVQPVHPGGAGAGSGGRTDEGNLDGPVTTVTRPHRPRVTLDDRPRLTGYRITNADHLGEGSLSDKAVANIEAIRTMKHVEAEGRPATLDEQKKLVKYTGWGALDQVFEHYQPTAALRQVAVELRDLLTPDEWKTAAATTPNAHYTSETVVRAVWDAVRRLGGKPGLSVLEPSMGSGNFFGLMPDDLQSGAKLSGVELDPVTARIAALLYPNAAVFPSGFEKTRFPDNWFDLAVSNVPFGNYGVFDKELRGPRRFLASSIHDFFFAKALDKVRPGGIVAFVTSRYTMDAKDPAVREYIQREAKFLGAVRLPQTAFEKNAGTTVVTDIVFLQKRMPGDASEAETWVKSSPTSLFPGDQDNPYQNDYYTRHPEMILGTVKGGRGRFGPELNVLGEVTPHNLRGAILRLPENVLTERPVSPAFKPEAIAAAEYPEAGHLKQGAFGIADGKLVRRTGEMLEPVTLGKEAEARVKGMIGIRDAMHEVFRTQLEDKPETEQAAARRALGKVYDAFVKKYGILNAPENIRAFRDDPDAPPLLALEKYDRKTKTATKTPVFTEPVIQAYKPVQSAGNALEAMTISLNEYGRLNWARMAQLTGLDPEALQDELGERIYRDPETQEWLAADEYLSGNIRQKLAQARDVAKADPSYERNIAALEAVKPPDLKGGTEIKGRLGSPWIPARAVERFIAELLGVNPRGVNVAYAAPLATWEVQIDNKNTVQNTSQWAGGDVDAHQLIEQALNMKTPVVRVRVSEDKTVVDPRRTAAAQEAQKKIRERFSKWLWEDPTRKEALEKLYNETYNATRLREYDGSHLKFAGMNPAVKLRPHQENAIWRVVSSGLNTLLAHVVGAGKTYEMAASAMELRRLGLAKKPVITVPANVVGQFGREFQHLYPAANLFVADETTFQKANRQKAMAQIATGNYDAAIISHDAFGLIPVEDETFNAFLQKEIDQLEDAMREMASKNGKADKRVRKELEKAKKRLEAKLREKGEAKKDTGLTWEQMGVDALFVDEADLFKNLYFTTRATRIAGIPNSESDRAFGMLIKSRHVTDKSNGRLVFATGTPISNTVAEMYTMLRYLSPHALEEAGISMFDAWAQVFGETVTGQEISPDGAGFRTNTRFAKFSNLPELQNLFRAVADVQTAEMLKLPVPKLAGGAYETNSIPATQSLRDFIMAKGEDGRYLPTSIMGRIERIKRGNIDPKLDNMLKVTSDGRKAALDLRLVGMPADPEGGKVAIAANRIFELWEQGKEKRATQLVFSDLSTPGRGWNVYDELRRLLTLKGVPAQEIAFAHDADTAAKKAVWQDAMNDGRIRITIGSTAKMGAGTNVQKRLIALHHLDVPWRPRDVEQREGRILRQGNTNPEVHIIRYVTAPSFDAYMWGMVARKAKFISQVMRGELGLREAEDISQDALGASEAEAAATGNPLVKEKATVDAEVFRLSALEADYAAKQADARSEAARTEQAIARAKTFLPKIEADIRTRDTHPQAKPEDFTITIGGKTYTERKAAGEALNKFALDRRMDEERHEAGTYRGFTIETRGRGPENIKDKPDGSAYDSNPPQVSFRGEALHHFNFSDSGRGTVQSLEHSVSGLGDAADEYRQEIAAGEDKLRRYQAEANTPFPDGATLDGLIKRQEEIAKLLDLDANAAVIDEPEKETPAPDAAGASEDPNPPALQSAPPGPELTTDEILKFVEYSERELLPEEAVRYLTDDLGRNGYPPRAVSEKPRTVSIDVDGHEIRMTEVKPDKWKVTGVREAFTHLGFVGGKRSPEAGFIDPELLTLGIPRFVREDVAPTLRSVAAGIRSTADDFMKLVFPTVGSRDGKAASLILRGKLAELARKTDQAGYAMREAQKFFNKQSEADNFDFMDRMEDETAGIYGRPQASADLDAVAQTMRTMYNDRRDQVRALGTGKLKDAYSNYIAHIYKNPKRAKTFMEAFFGRRPFEGRKSFLKRRKYPTLEDARAAGLEPLTDNPVTLMLLKLHEMDRYVMAHEVLALYKAEGMAKFFRGLKRGGPEWHELNDQMGTVYGVNAKGERVVRGRYLATEDAARILNNHLSASLNRSAVFRAGMGLNNAMNLFNLGLSGWHATKTAFEAALSQSSIGSEQVMRGHPLAAAGTYAKVPFAPFTAFMRGNRMLREWYAPGSQGALIGSLVDDLTSGGARARQDSMYRTTIAENMVKAFRRGNLPGGLMRAPFALVEAPTRLIMNVIVPAMKWGTMAEMAEYDLARLGPNAGSADVQRVMTEIVNEVDNRMGEVSRDNFFTHRYLKDLSMFLMRADQYTLGTVRAIGGAAADVVRQPYRAYKGEPVNLKRLAYVGSMIAVHMAIAALYNRFHTGQWPQDGEDYFYPRNGQSDENGRPQRTSLWSYIKDIDSFARHPVRTVQNKAAPALSLFLALIRNRDFRSAEVVHPDDTAKEQAKQLGAFGLRQFEPRSVENALRERALGTSPEGQAEQFFGLSPAPAEVSMTPAERLARSLGYAGGEKATTAEAGERRDLRQLLARALRENKPVPQEVKDAMKAGKFTTRDLKEAYRTAHESPLAASFTHLAIADAVKVYKKATPAEKRALLPLLLKKERDSLRVEAPAQRIRTIQSVREAIGAR